MLSVWEAMIFLRGAAKECVVTSAARTSIATQELNHVRHVVRARMRIPLFPIQDAGFIASDDFCHVVLSQPQIESPFANRFPYGRNFFRVALVLRFFPV